MKKFNFISAISLLLCLVLFAVGCQDDGKENVTGNVEDGTGASAENEVVEEIKDVPPVTVTADSVMSNFIKVEYLDNGALVVDKSLNEEYGTFCNDLSHSADLKVFRKITKDYMNNLTETYTVYSLKNKSVVKTFAHTYPDENYYREDEHGNEVFPDSEFYVYTDCLDPYSDRVDYIRTFSVRNTAIDGNVIEDNELENSYASFFSCEFYDAKGNHIATSSVVDRASFVEAEENELKATFGKVGAIFDIKENKLVKVYDADVSTLNIGYDYSNDRYNYYLNVGYGNVDYGTPVGFGGKIEVYTKGGELVCTYQYTDYAIISRAFVLANGDIMIQNVNSTDAIDYDVFFDMGNGMFPSDDLGEIKLDLQTLILDVETGKVTEIEFDYIISSMIEKDTLDDIFDGYKVTLNEQNVRNIALATKIENKTILDENSLDMIFFDDLLNVNYVQDKLVNEQDVTRETVPLPGGYTLVYIKGGVSDKAIVKDGQIVVYVPFDADVTPYGIITDDAIYDFEMNLIFDADPDEDGESFVDTRYQFEGYMGKYAIYKDVSITLPGGESDDDDTDYGNSVIMIDITSGSQRTFYDCLIEVVMDEYVVLYNEESGMHSLYNAELDLLLATDESIQVEYNYYSEVYVAEMTLDGEVYIFTLSNSEN